MLRLNYTNNLSRSLRAERGIYTAWVIDSSSSCIHSQIKIRVQEVLEHAEKWYVRCRASPHDQTTDPHHRGDPWTTLCFGEPAAGLGLRGFPATFILQMASLPSLVHGFHEHIEPVRGHVPWRCFSFFFPVVLKRAHFCVLPSSDEVSIVRNPHPLIAHPPTSSVLWCLVHFICPVIFTTDLITRGVHLA